MVNLEDQTRTISAAKIHPVKHPSVVFDPTNCTSSDYLALIHLKEWLKSHDHLSSSTVIEYKRPARRQSWLSRVEEWLDRSKVDVVEKPKRKLSSGKTVIVLSGLQLRVPTLVVEETNEKIRRWELGDEQSFGYVARMVAVPDDRFPHQVS